MSERSIDASFYEKTMKEGAPLSALSHLAENGDLYFVRLEQWTANADSSQSGILASVPARNWVGDEGNGSHRGIEIHMARPGQAMAINLIPDLALHESILSSDNKKNVGAVGLKEIKVVWPTVAPVVPLTYATKTAASEAKGAPWREIKQQTPGSNDPLKTGKGDKGEKEQAAKDERTWLQKNWIPLTLVTFIVANRLGGQAQQAQQRGPGGTGRRALPAGAPRPGTG